MERPVTSLVENRCVHILSADIKTRVMSCQYGGDPDCSQCGCIASMGLAAVGHHKVAGAAPPGISSGHPLRWENTYSGARPRFGVSYPPPRGERGAALPATINGRSLPPDFHAMLREGSSDANAQEGNQGPLRQARLRETPLPN
jgi:hypothetical protein